MIVAWKKAESIELSEKQKEILESYAKGTHVPLHLKIRSEIILKGSNGDSNNQISKDMGIGRKKVIRWRDRYTNASEMLLKVELEEPRKLKQLITNILSDEQRAGAPNEFTDAQKASIIALACMDPEELGLPFSHWTSSLLQVEAIKRGIVDSISTTHINRFLKSGGIKAPPSEDVAKS
jgi:putative transposase